MLENSTIAQEQRNLIEVIESIYMACDLSGEATGGLSVTFNHQAINNMPGWNIFLKNIRFELGYNQNRIRFGIPYDKEIFEKFCNFLNKELKINYTVKKNIGIKYQFEIGLDQHMYTDEGVKRIASLTNKILEIS
jgi:hypothetical protein